jgi:hypothetical protein
VSDATGIPWLVILLMILCPVAVVVFLGVMTFRGMTPLVYRCRRCNQDFLRAPHRRFPAICPHCGARDWSL